MGEYSFSSCASDQSLSLCSSSAYTSTGVCMVAFMAGHTFVASFKVTQNDARGTCISGRQELCLLGCLELMILREVLIIDSYRGTYLHAACPQLLLLCACPDLIQSCRSHCTSPNCPAHQI